MTAFSELAVLPEIAKAIEDIDWLLPTDVQAEAIPLILGGGDVLMAAETGSGKTGAFCLPIIQIVYETLRDRQMGKGAKRGVAVESVTKKMVLNPYDRGESFAISPDGLLCQCREQKVWHGGRGTLGVGSGRHYYEAVVTDEGLCRIGWSTDRATLELGKDKWGYGFGGTGKKSCASQFDDYGESFGKDDCIGCYIDCDNGIISFSKNDQFLGDAFSIPKSLIGTPFYPAVVLKNAEMRFNFGDTPFRYPPESHGFSAVSKATNPIPFSACAAVPSAGGGGSRHTPMAIILEPARELAQQTYDNIILFKKHLPPPGVKELLVMGGDSAKDQIKMLSEGVDIVCGTPGRLDDLISTGKLDLSGVNFFVLDEADGLLSQGNWELIMRIYNKIPKVSPEGRRLQMVVCSATLHNMDVKKLAEKTMHFPTWVDLKGQDAVPETVHHVFCLVDPTADVSWRGLQGIVTDGVHTKDNASKNSRSPEALSEAIKLLKVQYLVKAIDVHKMDQAIIFCRTKLDCDNVEQYLLYKGLRGGKKTMVNEYSCVCLHGDRRPQERKENLLAFKNGEVRFLICTDVAARGIDIRGIPYVVNVTLPDDKQNYIHRIGRVGRAERMGLAISLVAKNKEKVWYHKCPSKGKSCRNTALLENGGCTIWYDEMQYKAEVENHLGVVIPEVTPTFDVPVNEYDGKITYGEKKSGSGFQAQYHTEQLSSSVEELARLEKMAQSSFIKMRTGKQWFM